MKKVFVYRHLYLPQAFSLFKEIRVYRCVQLKKVFSSGWLFRYFQSLETIEVQWCPPMEELISSSTHEEEKVTPPNFQRLKLFKLLALTSICNHSSVLICDSIQSLTILACVKLKRIPLNFSQSSYPSSLKEIVVSPKEFWESMEWDHPNAKDVLLPFCKFLSKSDANKAFEDEDFDLFCEESEESDDIDEIEEEEL
ncbi:hypothetical protein SLA2020_042240 [Shorea laevis]